METEVPTIAAKVAPKTPDLSAEITQAVEKRPGERVVCRRVSPNCYRVNWFAPDTDESSGAGRFVQSVLIRDSRFLHVTRGEAGLIIRDMTVSAN